MRLKLLFIILLFITPQVEAKLCKVITDGEVVFAFDGKPTKTLGGTVSLLPTCKNTTKYAPTNPRNDCEKSAALACEPSFGGLPVCTTNNFSNFCGFCLLTEDTKGTTRIINGQIYDGSKSIDNIISCPNLELTK